MLADPPAGAWAFQASGCLGLRVVGWPDRCLVLGARSTGGARLATRAQWWQGRAISGLGGAVIIRLGEIVALLRQSRDIISSERAVIRAGVASDCLHRGWFCGVPIARQVRFLIIRFLFASGTLPWEGHRTSPGLGSGVDMGMAGLEKEAVDVWASQ